MVLMDHVNVIVVLSGVGDYNMIPDPLTYATTTTLTRDGTTISFLLVIVIFVLFLMVVAMVYNNFKEFHQPWR